MNRDQSQYDKRRYAAIKADPALHAAYLERKRRERKAAQSERNYETKRKRQWRANNPEASDRLRAAHHAVERAVSRGQLVRPATCSACGNGGRIEAHHHLGYERDDWLSVIWLCSPCHGTANREQQNQAA